MRNQDFSMSLGVAEKVFMAHLWVKGSALLTASPVAVKRR
jgi:hypothetical protein